jgi:hypothetical protein
MSSNQYNPLVATTGDQKYRSDSILGWFWKLYNLNRFSVDARSHGG